MVSRLLFIHGSGKEAPLCPRQNAFCRLLRDGFYRDIFLTTVKGSNYFCIYLLDLLK